MPEDAVYDDEVGPIPEEGTDQDFHDWCADFFLSDKYLPDRVETAFVVSGFDFVTVDHCRDYRFWQVRFHPGRSELKGCQKTAELKVWALLQFHGLDADKDNLCVRRDGEDYVAAFTLA